jgi:SAM-dependent methyltransferase
MTDTLLSPTLRCPPPRQAHGTVLNTIIEDMRESHCAQSPKVSSPLKRAPATISPQLKLITTGLPVSLHSRLDRLMPPVSAGTTSSSCSDEEWQSQIEVNQGYDDLYNTMDDDDSIDDHGTEISDSCFSPDTRPSSLVTPITRNSVTSTGTPTGSRKRYLTLEIPSPTGWQSMTGGAKSSPIPPTPPPKIPMSPAALSMLSRTVPASYAPPSLDGSISSDPESGLRTPDTQSLPDTNWNLHDIRVRPDLDGSESDLDHADARSDIQTVPIAIETLEHDWRHVLGSFPQIPSAAQSFSPPLSPAPSSSLHLSDEPFQEYDDLYDAPEPIDEGVCLPDSALAMLHHIRLDGTPDSWSEASEGNGEMSQLLEPPTRPKSADAVTPASALSGYSFSELSIPSPGGFFSSLAPRARHTWSIPKDNRRPSSVAAENFYHLPWHRDEGEIVEQVVECHMRAVDEDPVTAVRDERTPLTAIRLACATPTRRPIYQDSPMSSAFDTGQVQEIPRSGKGYEYDECYDEELQHRAVASHDRTKFWLAAQASYLSALNETNPMNYIESIEPPELRDAEVEPQDTTEDPSKKVVHFAADIPESLSPLPPIPATKDSIYWQGFQSIRKRSNKMDGFMHRNMRFDAIQSTRLGMSDLHINCLLGKYEVVRPERPAYKGPFAKAPRNSVITWELAEKAQFAKLEKEQLVLAQLCQPMWAMDALRSLNGGDLLTSPAQKILARTNLKPSMNQSPRRHSFRVLDLGGHSSCDWAWQAAYDFPKAKVYTVSNDETVNSAIKGPPNHHQVTVANLWELPFGNNQFDVISARSLHALLKTECPAGKDRDEYDLVLEECMRCLKPGGYLEFQVLDAEISRAGPYAAATSAEFAFDLRTRGYDPIASKSFLARLHSSGFSDTKRSWMFLPMGTEPVETEPLREAPAPRVQSQIEECEAVQGPVGSTADIASMTGLIGGWMWEQWLLKLRMEMGRERPMLLEGVGALFDEGRKSGAGWTCLSGWAMKPKLKLKSVRSSSNTGSI